MVYVLHEDGTPLMPTSNHAKVRYMLKKGLALIVKKMPFTIRLCYATKKFCQPISLGIDTGSRTMGVSATTETKVLYEANVTLRTDITGLLADKRENRRFRRSRKTRYRAWRWNNRKIEENWLPPTIRSKIDTHLQVIKDIHSILPVTNIVVEIAKFDLKKIYSSEPDSELISDFKSENSWNTREYVLWRDQHTCQACFGKSGDKYLNVHHIKSRKVGGNSPDNLITLCETCHKRLHLGLLSLKITKPCSRKDAVHANIIGRNLMECLKMLYQNVSMTYGYLTKNTRISNKLRKDHYIDARCISGHPLAKEIGNLYYLKKIRRHNRKLHKAKIYKGGKRRSNQLPYEIFGFHLFDVVKFQNKEYIVHGRRARGSFDIKPLSDLSVAPIGKSCKKLKFIRPSRGFIMYEVKK